MSYNGEIRKNISTFGLKKIALSGAMHSYVLCYLIILYADNEDPDWTARCAG